MRASGVRPSARAFVGRHHDERRGAVVDARRVAGGDGAVLLERRLQARRALRRSCPRESPRRDRRRRDRLSSAEWLIGRISSANQPSRVARGRLAVALRGVRVLFRARRPRRSPPRRLADMPMWHCSNAHHRPSLIIESTSVPLPIRSPSRMRGSRYGRVAHRLHAARDGDVDVAGRDALRREHHRLQPGAADLVDREGGDAVAEPAVERGLARRILPVARLDDVPHDALVDERRVDAGARARLRGPRSAPSSVAVSDLQRTEKLAGRGSDGATG